MKRHSIIFAALALTALLLLAPSAGAQGIYRGYATPLGYSQSYVNPWTGGYAVNQTRYNPWTGTYGVNQSVYNPYLGQGASGTSYYNPWTGRLNGYRTVYNPYTGQYVIQGYGY
ncbi:MAG: hypothetical protein U0736_15545 [Gemmataceae bacterium]